MSEPEHTESSFDSNSLRPHLLDSVHVTKTGQKRVVVCFCGERVKRSIVPHLKKRHAEEWNNWVGTFIELRRHGLSLKKIMRLFQSNNNLLLFSWTVIDRAIRSLSRKRARLNTSLRPSTQLECGNLLRFSWKLLRFGTSPSEAPGLPILETIGAIGRHNWWRNLILKYTNPGDLVLDPFMGGGTTLIEAWLLGRPSVGIDVSKLAHPDSHG